MVNMVKNEVRAKEVLKRILKKIKPSRAEQEDMAIFTKKIMKSALQFAGPFSAKPMVCGSVAKNTWLAGRGELDIFLLFNKLLPKKKLEEYGLRAAKDIILSLNGQFHIAYAEHPYLHGLVKEDGKTYDVDIVPCYDISPEKIKSAVDRTPHHVKFINENLAIGLQDEVRLLKAFCMAAGCYGADLKTQGFSGYLCELLILQFGKFYDCAKAAAGWRAGTVIDVKGEISKKEAIKKFKSPLIVIDPVDRNRSVAAALSAESFYKFVKTCKDFLQLPSEKFFTVEKKKPFSIAEISAEIKRRGTRWYLIKFEKPKILEDILWSQARRCIKQIKKLLENYGFKVLRSDFWFNHECILLFELDIWQIPKIFKNIGPNIYSVHAEEFLKHYKDYKIFIEGDDWAIEQERKFSTALHFLRDFFTREVKELKVAGIPNRLAPLMHNCKIVSGSDALRLVAELPEELRSFIKEYFEKNLNVAS